MPHPRFYKSSEATAPADRVSAPLWRLSLPTDGTPNYRKALSGHTDGTPNYREALSGHTDGNIIELKTFSSNKLNQ